MRSLRPALRLYLVTDRELCRADGLVETVHAAVAGGVTMVQLRDKHATTAERVAMAQDLKAVLAGTGVPLVINDDVAAAVEADVDGVHVGQGDLDPDEARAMLGSDRILGLSCGDAAEVKAADPGVVDYLGLGPVFGTPTKADHTTPVGLEGLAGLVALSPLPCVAIGGLKAGHVRGVLDTGADGLAVVSAICGQRDVTNAAATFLGKMR